MKPFRQPRRPSFLWQGFFILLPVVVLAVIGLLSLRQDRILAEQEARQRAQQIADDLASRVHQVLTSLAEFMPAGRLGTNFVFRIDGAGRLVDPPDYPRTPTPHPSDEARLNSAQQRLWRAAQTAEFREPNTSAAIQAYQQFIDSNPAALLPTARFELGLLQLKTGMAREAKTLLLALSNNGPEAQLESGLPMAPLAELKLLEQPGVAGDWFLTRAQAEAWCADAVGRPTLFTPRVLGELNRHLARLGRENPAERWDRIWRIQEQTRALYHAAAEQWFAGTVSTSPLPTDAQGRPTLPPVWVEAGEPPAGNSGRLSVRNPASQPSAWVARRASPGSPEGGTPNSAPRRLGGDPVREEPRVVVQSAADDGTPSLSEPWLVQPIGASAAAHAFIGRPESVLRGLVHAAIRVENLPSYFDASVTLIGRPLREAWSVAGRRDHRPLPLGSKNVWARPNAAFLASSGGPILTPADGRSPFARAEAATAEWPGPSASGSSPQIPSVGVAVYLSDPVAFYARQRQRTEWFAMLIAAAAAAATIGDVAAWRAFRRQQKLSELKSNFVSSVSHELRAPIASVRLMAEGLERGKIQALEKQRDYFRFIVQECRRLSALVENVLDISRIEEGRKQYELGPTDLVALVQHTVQLMAPIAAERQVHLAVTVPGEPVVADVDGKAIQQALVNLIDNAIKYSTAGGAVTVGLAWAKSEGPEPEGEGSPKSTVHTRPSHADGGESDDGPTSEISNLESTIAQNDVPPAAAPVPYAPSPDPWPLRLFVSDHGEGIPVSEHEKIFERFYRRGSELRRTTQGVGIGLNLVKHIVKAHGGWVRVESAVGQGSRFTIELPGKPQPPAAKSGSNTRPRSAASRG